MGRVSAGLKNKGMPMSEEKSIYQEAHLLAAALRVFVHQEGRQPMPEELAAFLGRSLENVLHVCHKMEEMGIVETVPSAFKNVLYLRDHTRIEELAQAGEGPSVSERLKEVEQEKQERAGTIEKMFSPAYADEKKKDLFADLQAQLKQGGKVKKPNPLDGVTGKK